MANILTSTNERMFQIKTWLGLNESPDGDTGLKMGEASVMRNWRITREGHLQIRPGYALRHTLGTGPVRCLWEGYVAGTHVLLAACDGHLWRVEGSSPIDCGTLADGPTSIFGFAKKAYILTGSEYYSWDGETLETVEGYIPIITTATPPEGGGTLLEGINKLNGKRRQRYSPDGTSTKFTLAERNITSVISVEGTDITWTADTAAGTVTFASAPAKGVNSITITYDKGTNDRAAVTAMRFAELYNGTTDNRVFLYGDNTNQTIYSDLDYDGNPSAEYFPDTNVLAAGTANTPITGMIRHFSRLIVFKLDGAFSVQSTTLTLADESTIGAFYMTPVQRDVGNTPMGQVRLVENNPRSLHGGAVYDWKATSSYITADERTIKRISQRIEATLESFDLADCITFDDSLDQEYYILHGDEALVHNYENDTWYYYDNFPAACMERFDENLYFGTADGKIMHLSRLYRNDNGVEIDARWESGAMDFEMDWKRKYSSNIWVSIEPESHARVLMTMKSNRKSDYTVRTVSSGLSTFSNVDFNHFSFGTNREPQVRRARIKVKKFTFSTLIFTSNSKSATATILGVDFQIRYTGNVK